MNASTDNILTDRRQDHELKEMHIQTAAVNETDHGHPPRPPARISISDRLWIFEIAAWFAGAIGLIAIIVVLRLTENKPTPNWKIQSKYSNQKLTVTINSVISIFSTLVKSTPLIPVAAGLSQLKWVWFRDGHRLSDFSVFDSSVRGPLGSFTLLWTFRGRSLACLGAIVVISSLGIDFAFQQLVPYPLRPVVTGPAFIGMCCPHGGRLLAHKTRRAKSNPFSTNEFIRRESAWTFNADALSRTSYARSFLRRLLQH